MFNGLKAQRRLALYVALGLSAGSGAFLDASTAYAAHDYTETAPSISGLEGTDKTHSMSDNNITIGTPGTPNVPFSTWGTISGGGKKNATEDVSGNTLTIHGLRVSNGDGQSMIYGGVSGTGAVTGNKVFFNNGLSKDPIYGGFNGASATKAVTGNAVTVAGGTVEGDAFGGVTQGTGAVTGNSVTITGGTLKDEAGGGVVTNASNSSDVTGNTLTISGGTFSKGNTNVYGAYTAGNGDVSGNTVAVSGGIIGTSAGGNIHGGYSNGSGTVSGNTVTISGGTLGGQAVLTTSGKIYGGYSGGTGKTINNVVNLGTAEGGYTAGTGMKRVEVYGGNRTSDVTGNALHVYAKGVEVEKIRNFESYNFHLTAPIKAGNTMLTLGSGNLGSGADWNKLNLDLSGWAGDTTKYGKIGTVTLMHSNSGSDIVFNNYAAKTGSSGDFEYNITAMPSMLFPTRTLTTDVTAEVNRFQNVDATADNVTGTEVYGGYSSLGNTTTNNKIKITNTNNTNLSVYGGYTAGDGNATNNHVTITATGKVKAAYGGYATAADSKAEGNTVTVETGGWVDNSSYAGWAKGAVNRNIFTVKGHADWSVYGGKLDGSGTAEGNEVRVEGGTVDGHIVGVIGGADSTVTGNKVTVTGGTVKKNISGGQSSGANGKATGNIVAITNSTVEGIVNGGHMTGDGTASDNEITISGSSTLEKAVYGGYADTTGTVTGNIVNISDGTFQKRVYGGYSDKSGTVTGNKVTITGGTFQDHVYGGAGGDNGSAYTAQNFAANNNTVTIAGGTFSGNIYGGVSWKLNGTATGNTVNLGDDTHTDISGTTLTNADIYGGKYSGNGTGTGDYVTGNTLSVNAKNAAAKSVNNFENYTFKLNNTLRNGDTMLTVTDAGDFAGTGVDWNKITVDRTGLSDASQLHGIHRISLIKRSNAADTLKFQNYAGRELTPATDTHEFGLVTDTNTDTANAAVLEINRFKDGNVSYDGTGETYTGASGTEIYGGISRYGHTTTGNTLTVTGIKGANDPQYAFGGINKGATGDATSNTLNIELADDRDTMDEAYAGEAEDAANAGEVSGNTANMKKGTVNKIYGGHTFGTGAVKNNTVNFSGGESTDYVAGGYVDNAGNSTEVSGNKVVFTGGTAVAVEGAAGKGTGALKNNTVEFSGTSSTADTLRGAKSDNHRRVESNGITLAGGTVANVYGAVTDGTGVADQNHVTITGGTVSTEVAGGVGYNVTANTVTISGGTVSGDVYGGKSSGPGSSTSGNIVNLGAEDGTYTANLTNAVLHGDNNSGTGATLNVRAKNITAKSADKFANYTFHLNDDIAQNGGSMLTLTENNGFNDGNQFDWTKLDVDTSKLSGSTVIGNATLLTGTTNGLKFSNYAGRNRTTAATNGDYETALRTDTNTGTATKVILDYNRFQNNTNATYDGSTPATRLPDGTTEIYGGISYAGNTTKNNHLTVTGVQGNLTSAYGGKTAGAKGDAVKNHVTVEQTNRGGNAGAISNVFGGYTSSTEATAKAEDNTVTIKDGTVGAVYGGYAENAASAAGNHVFIQGGTVQNAVVGGGGKNTATGNMSGNEITITGGTVSGKIIGGDSRVLTSTSDKNIINLGDDTGTYAANLSSAQIWGTSYGGSVLANTDTKIAGNTLNVKAKNGAEVAKVRNFEKFNFLLHDDTTKTAPLLNLTEAGGFGGISGTHDDVKVAWSNVTADTSGLSAARGDGVQGKNTITLLQSGASDLKFDGYTSTDTAELDRVYEKKLHTDTNSGTASKVQLELNRFKDGTVTHNGTTAPAEVYGGYSAYDHTERDADGHDVTVGTIAEGNTLEITDVATGTNNLKAYGGYAAGAHGGAVNNTVTVNVTNSGAGAVATAVGGYTKGTGAVRGNTLRFSQGATLHALMGGYSDSTTSAADVTYNTVTVEGGTVSADTDGGAVYGGRTNGTGKAEHNTVNLLGGTVNGIVVGGYSDTAPALGVDVANDNTINLYGTTVNGAIVGGAVKDSHGDKIVNGTGNTLAIHARGAKAHDFLGVQNLHFYIPEGTTADPAAATMLRLTNVGELSHDDKKNLSNVNVRVGLAGSRPTLNVGDTVSLMKAYKVDGSDNQAVEIINAPSVSDAEGMHGISLRYKFNLLTREAQNETDPHTKNETHLKNELVAEVSDVSVNDQTKSLVETRVAATAMINSSGDLLADSGIGAAINAVSAAAHAPAAKSTANAGTQASAASAAASSAFQMWAAQSGSATRLNSGSYVDAKGWNLNLGFAKQATMGRNTVTYGPFIEYGRGTYDSYLDDGTHGDGSMSHVGVGVMAVSKSDSGAYVEGSLRAGRVKSDYAGDISNTTATYDSSSTYYAAHIGVGREKELKGGDTIDTYAKYFYSHQGGDTVKLNTGEVYDFDAVNSSRLRIGARYTKKLNGGGAFYTGLAYEYEFGSDAGATFGDYSTPSPSLKGSTGVLELGYRFAPKSSNVSYGVSLMGMTGKRRGISGGVQINWAF